MNAVDFHSRHAEDFFIKYQNSKDFIQRYKVWTNAFDEFINPGEKIVDMGCGTGVFSVVVAQKASKVICIDGSKSMIDYLENRIKENNIKNISIICDYLPQALDSIKEKQDVIFASSVLEYLDNAQYTIGMAYSLLESNGRLLVSIPNKDAFYRKLEKLIFWVLKIPSYYKHIKFTQSAADFEILLNEKNFKIEKIIYYGNQDIFNRFISKLFGQRFCNNMFLAIARKI